MTRVINFSGGRSSALMTILLKPTVHDIVLFCDTGREVDGTYQFIDDFEKNEGIKVHRAIYKNKNAPHLSGFDAITVNRRRVPNIMERYCTKYLKTLMAKRFLRPLKIGHYHNYIGFRSDEPDRVTGYVNYAAKATPVFTLFDMGVIKADVMAYWKAKPYDLNIPPIMGNCDLCFLKGKNAIIRILQHHPELAEKWIKDERHGTYIKGISYKEMLDMARNLNKVFDLDEIESAYSCSCHS
jgi:Phosphoadenosine phosphosulfate reductase family